MLRSAEAGGGDRASRSGRCRRRGVRRFIAGVPAPLGIGTIELGDGTRPKGFLCEPAGIVGAEDVTAIGDWRRVMAETAA